MSKIIPNLFIIVILILWLALYIVCFPAVIISAFVFSFREGEFIENFKAPYKDGIHAIKYYYRKMFV